MKRSLNLDVIKGIGICLVVLGHCGCPFTHFIYLFHVPLFFIASGFVYNSKYSDDFNGFKTLFFKKVKSLWLPYFFFNVSFLLLSESFISLNAPSYVAKSFFEFVKTFFLIFFAVGSGGAMAGACWFLSTLFLSTLFFVAIEFAIRKISPKQYVLKNFVFGVLLFLISYFLIKNNIRSKTMEHIAGAYVMLALGNLLKTFHFERITNVKWAIIAVICLVTLFFCNNCGSIELGKGVYTSPVFFMICAISGWFLMYAISVLIVKLNTLCAIFCYIGRNTICIIGLHFLSFKIVTQIQIVYYDLPQSQLSSFPFLLTSPFWWLAYAVVGICVPLLLNFFYKKMMKIRYRLSVGLH